MRIEYFQLIDRIVALDIADQTIRTEAVIPAKSTIFQGHFPGHPLMPGVLLCEAMAQTAGWLIIALTRFERMPFLAALKEAKLRTFVSPGEKLTLTAKMLHDGSGYAMTEAECMIGEKLICDATITFRVVPFPNAETRSSMQKFAERLEFPMEMVANG